MKTAWWIIFSFLFLGIQQSKAQYITIPDIYFVDWLETNGYASCLNGNQIDTTCAAVSSTTFIDCSAAYILDLSGISVFNNLDTLICSFNDLTFLPNLPPSLLYLDCSLNEIDSLGALPASIRCLVLAGNEMSHVAYLPDSLEFLTCGGNSLTALPSLPSKLKDLACSENQLQTLPILPPMLKAMDCQNNQLSILPDLPASLETLICNANELTYLPSLPSSLTYIVCNYNNLTSLPVLPSSLTYLDCFANQLTSLPNLPYTLTDLVCHYNQLASLPPLPTVMHSLYLAYNPLLSCLPPIEIFTGGHFEFWIVGTNITCLPNFIQHSLSIPAMDTLPICEIINQYGCIVDWNIFGNTFNDLNGDCSENGEDNLKNIKVSISRNDTLLQQFFTTTSGLFSFQMPLDTYELQIDIIDLPFNVFCPSDNIHTSTLTATNLTDSAAYFALQCKPGFDVVVNALMGTGWFFPGNIATVEIHAGDIASYYGTTCNTSGLAGTVTATVDVLAAIDSVSNNGLVSGNQITWNVANFSTVDFFNDFWLQLTTDTTAQAGDQICITVTVSASTGTDNNPLNDTLTHCFTVVNSYDPNIKEVYPETVSEPGDWHIYTIHFQNTGTAAAQNIVVKDTLDANLDWSSFQLLAYSHENLTQVLQNGIVHFNFPNIQLPDSNSNEPDSHGFVQYKVKTDSTITYGTEIHNTAAIYFDFNAPVITNDALLVYAEPENISSTFTSTNTFTLYPNPANDQITVQRTSSTKALIQLTDLTGKLLLNIESEQKQTNLSLEHLSAGAYLIRLMENDRVSVVKKLIVIR